MHFIESDSGFIEGEQETKSTCTNVITHIIEHIIKNSKIRENSEEDTSSSESDMDD